MLSLVPDFWLWFWAIFAVGAVVTIAASLVIATVPPWTGWHHQPHTPAALRPAAKAPARVKGAPARPRPASA
jgi:hypothetical protein